MNKYGTLRDVTKKYLNYRNRYPNRKNRLNTPEFSKAIKLFNQKVIDRIIFENYDFTMTGLGTLSLKKNKIKKFKDGKINPNLAVDWKKTKEYGKRIYHMNEHTDGYKYLFDFKPRGIFKNINYYGFKIARQNSRYLAKILKNPSVYGKVNAYLK